MSERYKTEAIVLRRQNLGENHQIITLFSPTHGKIRAVAKGIRKITSRFIGKIELFNYLFLYLASGKELDVICEVEVKKIFSKIKKSLLKISFGTYFLQIVNEYILEGEKSEAKKIFNLLKESLDELERIKSKIYLEILSRTFEIKFLSLSGYSPRVSECLNCLKNSGEFFFFSSSLGGALCLDCRTKDLKAFRISPKTLKLAQVLSSIPIEEISNLKVPYQYLSELKKINQSQLNYSFSKTLQTPAFLNQCPGN